MTLAFLISSALLLGVDLRRVALLAMTAIVPVWVAAGMVLLIWRGGARENAGPALFCEAVASELRAGASLRHAVTDAAGSFTRLPIPADLPMAAVAEQVAIVFPEIGDELRLTIVTAGAAGSDTAALFDEIGSLALAQTEIRHEVRMAIAPGRAAAMVLVGAPLLYLAAQIGSGGVGELLVSPQQRVVALFGLGLFLAGVAAAAAVIWRGNR